MCIRDRLHTDCWHRSGELADTPTFLHDVCWARLMMSCSVTSDVQSSKFGWLKITAFLCIADLDANNLYAVFPNNIYK